MKDLAYGAFRLEKKTAAISPSEMLASPSKYWPSNYWRTGIIAD
jgi:hypothetical protein